MESEDVIRGRRSIRAYTTEPVADDLVRDILDQARWAPSSQNTQPWRVWVLTGDALERFKAAFKVAVAREEAETPDLAWSPPEDWPAAFPARVAENLERRVQALEASGEDPGPAASLARMADCFGAPVLLVVGFEGALAPAAAYDVGSFVQTVCLAAHDRGLGTCQCATLTGYPGLLRDLLPGAHGARLVVAVTLGWPDREAPINIYRRPRAPLEELVVWVS